MLLTINNNQYQNYIKRKKIDKKLGLKNLVLNNFEFCLGISITF